MAWQARIEGIQLDTSDTDAIFVTVSFYDDATDATGANPPFIRQLRFPVTATRQQMLDAVGQAGSSARAAVTRRNVLLAQAPPGTLISIP